MLLLLGACSPDSSNPASPESSLTVAPFQAEVTGAVTSNLQGENLEYFTEGVVSKVADGTPILTLSFNARTKAENAQDNSEEGNVALCFNNFVPAIGTYLVADKSEPTPFGGYYTYRRNTTTGSASINQVYRTSSGTMTITAAYTSSLGSYLVGTISFKALKESGVVITNGQLSQETANGEMVDVTMKFQMNVYNSDN